MHRKQIAGLILLAIGVLLIIFSIHAMWKISEAKDSIDNISNFFQHNPTWNPLITFFGGKAEEEVAKYDLPVLICLVSGMSLTFIGCCMAFIYRMKK